MVTPERITLARRRRGRTAAKLAKQLSVSAQTITAYEHGVEEPGAETLSALAKALNFPQRFFNVEATEDLPEEAVSFRGRDKISQRKRAAALSAGVLATEFNGWLERNFVLPSPNVLSLERAHPETAAEMMRAHWGLGIESVVTLIPLLELHGVRVFSVPADQRDVDAFSFWQAGTPYLFLDTTKAPEHVRFDAAHELGHLVLHAGSRATHGPTAEQEALAFASAFLMPELNVRGRMPRSPLPDQVLEGKRIWGVPSLVMADRLRDLDMLSDRQHRSACVELSRLGCKQVPESVGETSQLLGKVVAALRERGTSLRSVAAELSLAPDELAGMVFGLVVTAVCNHGQSSARRNPRNMQPSAPTRLTLA